MEYYQDVLRGLESGSAEYLRQLGRGIEQFDAWRTTLASDEHRYFQNALANEETWERTTQPGKVDSSFDGDVETLSFRIRAMLYDNGVSALFPSQLPCCVDEKQSAIYEASFRQEMVTVEVSKPLRADVDEDYDFDLDDDNEKMPNGDRQSTHEPEIQHQDADEKEEVLDEMEESVILAENSLSRMFHTLEYDRMAMLEQNHLEESDRQVDLEGKQNGRMSDVNFGAASLSLKHLISVIDAKREALAMSDIELRSLISEVRKNRSKWASEERVGQEELYEAAEKVVIELRAYTEHSSAFLNRVSKREAPDYYNIIKYPMDLGTVMKKLKALQYKSKKEFVEDLQIIWQNCLTYNADPNHFLRKHAMAMHKKTLSLIPLIPDITIKERTEMEAENGYALDADGDDSDEEPIVSSRKGPAGSSKTTAKSRTFAPAKTNGDTKPNDQREHSFSIEPFLNAKEEVSSPASASIAPADLSIILPPELEPPEKPDLDGDLDTGDVEFRNWKSQTKKARAKLAIKRQKLFRGTRLNDDEEALVRTRHGMEEFEELERHHASFPVLLDVDRPQSAHENASAVGTHAIPLLQKMVDYDPCSGIPDNDPSQFARQGNDLEIQPPMSAFTAESRGLINVMNSNIATIQEIRNVCGKIHVIKQMQTSQPMVHSKEKVLKNIDKEIFFPAIEIDDRPLSREVSHSILQRSMIRLLCHCGFESSESAALNVLTDLASDYLGKIGKSMSTYLETRRDKFPIQDHFVQETLRDCGIENFEELEQYINEDIHKYGVKLKEICRRMRGYLADLLRPAIAEAGDDSAMFNDDSEQYVGGNFAEDIDDDFFGFRELGLDQELGIAHLSVPLHLLQGRMKKHIEPDGDEDVETVEESHKARPAFAPMNLATATTQIALVRDFLLARLEESESGLIVEDDDDPIAKQRTRPKVASSGKIISSRKRSMPSSSSIQKKKKKLEKDVEEKDVEEKADDSLTLLT